MGFKGRTKFVVAGYHPLLSLVRDRLIRAGYALVPWSERPDFCLFGGEFRPEGDLATELLGLCHQANAVISEEIPVLLLGAPEHGMPPPASKEAPAALFLRTAESLFLRGTRTVVLRTFNVYGPDIRYGVVHEFLMAAQRQEPLKVYGHGYQQRTFLYQEDFLSLVEKAAYAVAKENARGVYEVGHAQEISINRLADSIWQLTNGASVVTSITRVEVSEHLLDEAPTYLARTSAKFGWKPQTSLRQGLWLMVGNVQELSEAASDPDATPPSEDRLSR